MGTAGETACPTLLDQSFGEVGGAGGFACRSSKSRKRLCPPLGRCAPHRIEFSACHAATLCSEGCPFSPPARSSRSGRSPRASTLSEIATTCPGARDRRRHHRHRGGLHLRAG